MRAEQQAGGGAVTPLFPLDTVLFPGGPLALRIFEHATSTWCDFACAEHGLRCRALRTGAELVSMRQIR